MDQKTIGYRQSVFALSIFFESHCKSDKLTISHWNRFWRRTGRKGERELEVTISLNFNRTDLNTNFNKWKELESASFSNLLNLKSSDTKPIVGADRGLI